MPRHALPLLCALLCFASTAPAQEVGVERGDVTYRASPTAPLRHVTTSGLDSQPVLSPDGRWVAWARATPRDSVEGPGGWVQAGEIWIARTDGTGARMLARGRGAAEPRELLAGLDAPRFSPDGRRVYFLSRAWATSGALHAADVATGRRRFVAPANGYEVVPRGRWRGHLVAWQHRYFLAGGSYDWAWLLAPDGAEVGAVGETEAAVAEFLAVQEEEPRG
jgi:dipeptidyl aminopeptidase/acylaminoacyl peptidase